jgi:geranylgeranyl diphosphate synthase type II
MLKWNNDFKLPFSNEKGNISRKCDSFMKKTIPNFSKLEKYLSVKKDIIDARLKSYFPHNDTNIIWESMGYSLMAGGKRLRPLLTVAVAEVFDYPVENVIPAACAIEMIHTQSLVHDDLPAMDNDDLRRGKPTNHVVFGEAIAIITGDALFASAFMTISKYTPELVGSEKIVKVIFEIAEAAGAGGMCGGQALDVTLEKNAGLNFNEEILYTVHRQKTGALIRAAVRSGAILAGTTDAQLENLTEYSENIGLAFQIIDDVLDVTGDSEKLGKKAQKDDNKLTFPKIFGVDKSLEIAEKHVNYALENISSFGEKSEYLELLAHYILKRNY